MAPLPRLSGPEVVRGFEPFGWDRPCESSSGDMLIRERGPATWRRPGSPCGAVRGSWKLGVQTVGQNGGEEESE
jgi:hypothetical protein